MYKGHFHPIRQRTQVSSLLCGSHVRGGRGECPGRGLLSQLRALARCLQATSRRCCSVLEVTQLALRQLTPTGGRECRRGWFSWFGFPSSSPPITSLPFDSSVGSNDGWFYFHFPPGQKPLISLPEAVERQAPSAPQTCGPLLGEPWWQVLRAQELSFSTSSMSGSQLSKGFSGSRMCWRRRGHLPAWSPGVCPRATSGEGPCSDNPQALLL